MQPSRYYWELLTKYGCYAQSAMAQYNEVFGVLLELRMMSFQLQRLWLDCVHQHGTKATELQFIPVLDW